MKKLYPTIRPLRKDTWENDTKTQSHIGLGSSGGLERAADFSQHDSVRPDDVVHTALEQHNADYAEHKEHIYQKGRKNPGPRQSALRVSKESALVQMAPDLHLNGVSHRAIPSKFEDMIENPSEPVDTFQDELLDDCD